MFEWDMVDDSSCNWSITSDDDSINAERNGSRFNSPSWEDDVAKVSIKPDLLNTLHHSPHAQQFCAYQPDQILDLSSTRYGYDRSLNAGPEALSCPYGEDLLVGVTDKPQDAQTSLNGLTPSIYSILEADKQFNISQRTPKGILQSPMDDISFQNMQHSSCLSCGATTMWPEAPFYSNCMLNYNPLEDLYHAFNITSSTGYYIETTSGVAVPRKKFVAACHRGNLSDVLLVKADKAPEIGKRNAVTGRCMVLDASPSAPLQGPKVSLSNSDFFKKLIFVCQLSADAETCHGQKQHERGWIIEPCECFKPRSSHPYDRDKENITDSRMRKRSVLTRVSLAGWDF